MLGHEPHRRRRRHGPESANDDADERPANHDEHIVRRNRHDRSRSRHHDGQTEKQHLTIEPARYRGNEKTCQNGERAGYGRSFTKAAARFGISQSALSQVIRHLEARLGVRLVTRTTRAVALTEAGERLLERIGPHFDQIEAEIEALNELRENPAGTVRINAPDYAISSVLWPKLKKFLPKYPDIKVEILLDNGLTDIVTERYDAGIRMGDQLAKD